MHTFFINTSGRELENYEKLMEIQHETRKLISLDCPMRVWQDETLGYKGCVRKMGEMIDHYKDINNHFNLIIYIDLFEYDVYTSLPLDGSKRERYFCREALHKIFRHHMAKTIVRLLSEQGRTPQEVLLIFEETEKPTEVIPVCDGDEVADGKICDSSPDGVEKIYKYLGKILGLPSEKQLDDFYSAIGKGDQKIERVEDFCELLARFCDKPIFDSVFELYLQKVEIALKDVCLRIDPGMADEALHFPSYEALLDYFFIEKGLLQHFADPEKGKEYFALAMAKLYQYIWIYRCEELEFSGEKVELVSFETDRLAGAFSTQERAQRDLRLSIYLLNCVKKKTIYLNGEKNGKRLVKDFPRVDDDGWQKLAVHLQAKAENFKKQRTSLVRMQQQYTDLGLAPQCYAFDHEKFTLDEFGLRGKTLNRERPKAVLENSDLEGIDELDSVITAEASKRAKSDAGSSERSSSKRKKTSNADQAKTEESNNPFEDYVSGLIEKAERKTKDKKGGSEQKDPGAAYKEAGEELKNFHWQYLRKLKEQIISALSGYAGRSAENDQPMLSKRHVSMQDVGDVECERSYRYAKEINSDNKNTNSKNPHDLYVPKARKKEAADDLAKNAYATAETAYLRSNMGRSVEASDIEEQYDWFERRIDQITASLQKIKIVAVMLWLVLMLLYIPFFALQAADILENSVTLAIAGLSIGIPILLLYLIFAAISLRQKKKYAEAWDEFVEKSNEALEKNRSMVNGYYRLLSVDAPALRWIYEYKLDCEFYDECCDMARAKIEHHENKMAELANTAQNIVEDLELDELPDSQEVSKLVKEYEKANKNEANESQGRNREKTKDLQFDCSVSFCFDKKNQQFYSILDDAILDLIEKTAENA